MFAALAASAPDAQVQAAPHACRFGFAVHGWLPALKDSTQLPSGAGGPSIDADADTLFST